MDKGLRFGRLTTTGKRKIQISSLGNKWYKDECICDCGTVKFIISTHIRKGNIKSCGCLKKESCSIIGSLSKHGMYNHRIYSIYGAILARCNNIKKSNFNRYGGRGIKCERDDFQTFYNDMYDSYLIHASKFSEKDTTIDRIDGDGNYCKENCKWSTMKEQQNNRCNNNNISFNGKTCTLSQWADSLGIKRATLQSRLSGGWSIEKSFTTKPNRYKSNR